MSQRLTNFLGYLTLFAILGAIWVLFGEDPSREQRGRGEPTFEGMKTGVNDASTLSFTKGNDSVTLVRGDDGWRIEERSGFLADTGKVRAFLRGVARSERREPKTSNPERFDRIGLGDDALKVSLRGAAGTSLLTFDMGDRSEVTADRSLTYIFQSGDTRSWLVTALTEAEARPIWWLPGTLLDLNAERFSRLEMGGAVLNRAIGETGFTLEDLTESDQPKASWQLSEPARLIARLGYDDVIQLGNPLSEPVATVRAVTHDGLALKLSLYAMEGGTWAQLSAAFDGAVQNDGADGELPTAPADGAAEAASISAKALGWFFKLADYDAQVLMRKRPDFIEPAEDVDAPAS